MRITPAIVTAWAACVTCAACNVRGPTRVANTVGEGISIALYAASSGASYALVDDRRSVEVSGTTLVLDQIDPAATLSSLEIEAVGRVHAIHLGACTRDRIPPSETEAAAKDHVDTYVPVVRCAIVAAPGRYLLRIVYAARASTLGYRAVHAITMTTTDHATVITRFALTTPRWNAHADLVIFDGLPGEAIPPRELARGSVALDGTIAVLAVPPREVAAQLRRVYDGAVIDPSTTATEPMWGRDSTPAVWVWLELPNLELAPGLLQVHVALTDERERDIDVPIAGLRETNGTARAPLWIDESLLGMRQRFFDVPINSSITERFVLSVTNSGDAPREVWVEEHLRPARHRRVEDAWPGKPIAVDDRLRAKLDVRPGKIARAGFTVAYEF